MDAVVTTAQQPTLWESLREAVRGSHQDYTAGSLNRAILLLAIPMVLEMVLESLFAVVDVFWVARLGSNAVATVGLTESMLTLVFAVAMGLGMSTTAMVARRIGEKDREGAAVASVQAIGLGIVVSAMMGLPCLFLARTLLRLMGASQEIVLAGSGYTRIALGCSGVVVLLTLNNAVFRGAGDAVIAMRVLWVSNLINLFLDPCLIFGLGPFPRLGVTGAAAATLTGRSIGLVYQFFQLLSTYGFCSATYASTWASCFACLGCPSPVSYSSPLHIPVGSRWSVSSVSSGAPPSRDTRSPFASSSSLFCPRGA